MPPARSVCLPLFSRQPLYFFRSPSVRYPPLNSLRSLRKPARSRPSRLSSTTQSHLWPLRDDETHVKSGVQDINFFEVEEEAPNKRRRVASEANAEELKRLRSHERDLKNATQEVEHELDSAQQENDEAESIDDMHMTEGEENRMHQVLLDSIDEMQNIDVYSNSTMPHRVKVDAMHSKAARLFLRKLNESLDAVSVDVVDAQTRQNLWRYYERSKIYIPNVLQILPDEAWQLLWMSQSEDANDNPHRASHLKILGEDMAKAGRSLTEEQRFARIEGLFWSGKPVQALEQWEAGLCQGDGGKVNYLEMGIRMYSFDRKLERAEQLLGVLFSLHSTCDPHILLQVMIASLGRADEGDVHRAWKLYQRFRLAMSSDISMENYDQISIAFLRAGQKDHALAVFRDMMLASELEKSPSGIAAAVTRLGSFVSSSSSNEEVNMLNLESLAFLPRQYQNKFFYASWMKKLIGMGELQAAAQVLELMQERGVRPDAKHVNGLISGWLRSSDKAVHKEAEKIAWGLIQSRLDFVEHRRQHGPETSDATSVSIHDFEDDGPDGQPRIPVIGRSGPLPPATIETFSILVQYYLRRSIFSNIRHLRNLLAACEIPINSYFMNHLLYAELRNRSHQEVWARFLVMSRTISPDIETFGCLWECMKVHLDPGIRAPSKGASFVRVGFPAPRDLMRRMREWFATLQGQQKRDALADMDIDTYNDIVRCFCLSMDPAGSFVAIHCLREMFDIAPDPDSMRMLILQIARLNLPRPRSHRQARKFTASKNSKENIARTTEVLDLITQYRAQGYRDKAINVEEMGEHWQREERHRVALQLLFSVNQQVGAQGEEEVNATRIIRDAARIMGVEDLDVEDSMALLD